MAADTLWPTVLKWTVWGVLMALVMGWLARSRHRARPALEERRLVHPPSTLIIGVVCFAFFAGLAVLSHVFENKTRTWWTDVIFIGFALMAVPMIADYFIARHLVSEEGMAYRKLTGARRSLRWTELRTVRYSSVWKWFRLETRSGDVARVSVLLMGLPEFARLLLAGGPRDALDPETLRVLEETADGRPPSVWA